MTCSPAFFERLVVDLLLAMGYGGSRRDAGEAVGKTPYTHGPEVRAHHYLKRGQRK
jgi:hypothetical protein